jgi:transposase
MSDSTTPKVSPVAGPDDERTFALLKQIQSGRMDPSSVSKSSRRQLVVHLINDGYSTPDIAEILKVSDRTIERDRKAIRESNALSRDPRLVEQMTGRLVGEAELCVQRIRKAARDKEASPMVRIEAEHKCFQIVSGVVEGLQRLGYLPTATQKLEAELTHHAGSIPEYDAIDADILRLKEISKRSPGSDAAKQVALLEQTVVRTRLATEVESLSAKLENDEENPNDTTE